MRARGVSEHMTQAIPAAFWIVNGATPKLLTRAMRYALQFINVL
jgi:hypothetical protein